MIKNENTSEEGKKLSRHRNGYKFTEKKQSARGIFSFLLACASALIFGSVVWYSYQSQGNGSMYLGSAGVASLLLGVVALVLAVLSLREENSFKFFPYLATLSSFFVTGLWVALYVVGFVN